MKNLNKILCSFLLILTFVLLKKESLATIYTIDATLQGTQEVPPNPSTGTGTITGTYNDVTRVLDFNLTFTGLLSTTTAAHFHAPAARGVNAPVVIGFVGFPVGVTSGVYANSYVLTPAQNIEIISGLWYVNVHTNGSPGGEIRAQLDEGTLPVELSSFVSQVFKNNVTLNWTTAAEINNSGFNIERKSFVSGEWRSVGFVAGVGNSSHSINYSFIDRGLTNGNYNYRLRQTDLNGNYEYYDLENEVVIGSPAIYSLNQNYPNPFNPTTKIDFDIPESQNVKIRISDMSGREVAILLNEYKPAGYYSIGFSSEKLSSGVYYYTLTAGNFVSTKMMIVLK